MKKIFFAAILSLVTVLCVAATVADSNSTDTYSSSITATVAGMNEGIDFDTKTVTTLCLRRSRISALKATRT